MQPVQCGKPADVHGFHHEFRVMENRAKATPCLLCMGLFFDILIRNKQQQGFGRS